jgi:hypothetical protein
MDRLEAMKRHRENSLRPKLLEVMDILAPGEQLRWGAKKHDDLVGFSAIMLAEEYTALTGMAVVELLQGDRAIDDDRPQKSDVVSTPIEEALPL